MKIKKIKVALDKGPLKSGDTVRGIGFHAQHLVEEFKKIKDLDYELVDTSKINLAQYDLVHYQKFTPFFLRIPFKKEIKSVITIHDLIPLIYSKAYPPGVKGKLAFEVQKRIVRKMEAIITISETSKKDICRFLGVSPDKVYVIYLGVKKVFGKMGPGKWMKDIRKKYLLPEKFVLYVGDVNYNKNVATLAEACLLSKIPLVMVGKQAAEENFDKKHPENKPFAKFLEKYGKEKTVKRIGFVEDNDLNKIYNLATIYCQPSFYEGFGLPMLEAFATQVPVIAAKNNCHVEIGQDAFLAFDPKDTQDLVVKMNKLLEDKDLREMYIKRGTKRVSDFDWAKTAKETVGIYQKVLETKS